MRDICGTDSLGSDPNPTSISNLFAFCFFVRHLVSLLPKDVQQRVYVVDPLILGFLLSDEVSFLQLLAAGFEWWTLKLPGSFALHTINREFSLSFCQNVVTLTSFPQLNWFGFLLLGIVNIGAS